MGRGAYTDRVKAILLACRDEPVIEALVDDLHRYQQGTWHDETQWLDVSVHACQELNSRRQVIFLTPFEVADAPDFLGRARDDGYHVVIVPENVRRKLPELRDAAGNPMRDLTQYRAEWEDSFQFSFVEPASLTEVERQVWEMLPAIFDLRGGRLERVKDVLISETMRLVPGQYQEAVGMWDAEDGRIVVHRGQLKSLTAFGGTVLHEVAHALSGAPDVSLEFEEALTQQLGSIVGKQLAARSGPSNEQVPAPRETRTRWWSRTDAPRTLE